MRHTVSISIEPNRYCRPAARKIRLPEDCIALADLDPEHSAIRYLRGRRFDPIKLAREYDVSYCVDSEHPFVANRIIIPILLGGKLAGWQARYVGDAPPQLPKYFTSPSTPLRRILYNYDCARNHEFGVIVEGVPDAWRVGGNAVAMFKSTISPQQMDLIVEAWGGTGVVLLVDGDQRAVPEKTRNHERTIDRLISTGAFPWGVLDVVLPVDRDPADYSSVEIQQLIIRHAAETKLLNFTIPRHKITGSEN
jgi:hypothetical protein